MRERERGIYTKFFASIVIIALYIIPVGYQDYQGYHKNEYNYS